MCITGEPFAEPVPLPQNISSVAVTAVNCLGQIAEVISGQRVPSLVTIMCYTLIFSFSLFYLWWIEEIANGTVIYIS